MEWVDSGGESDVQRGVDWQATATLLLERMRSAAFVIGGDATLQVINHGFVKLLGCERSQFVGHSLNEALPLPDAVEWPLDMAFGGAIREFTCVARNATGQRVTMSGELSVVGRGASACLLAITTSHRIERCRREEMRYWVRRDGNRTPLLRLWRSDGSVEELDGEHDCFEYLHSRTSPCPQCPLFIDGGGAESTVLPPAEDACSRIVSTRAVPGAVEVTALGVPDEMVSQLLQARIDTMAREACLTEREQTVLRYILLARCADEIATIMEISARTVKFHQANLLGKIGAESRMDLFRLLL